MEKTITNMHSIPALISVPGGMSMRIDSEVPKISPKWLARPQPHCPTWMLQQRILNAIEKEQFGPNFSDGLIKYGYTQSTLLRALDEHGYTCTPAPKFDKKELGSKYLALLCYKNNHWFIMVVNEQKSQIYVLDSLYSGPEQLSNYPILPEVIWGIYKHT